MLAFLVKLAQVNYLDGIETLGPTQLSALARLTIADSSYTARLLQQPRTTKADGHSALSELTLTSSQH